MVLNDCILQYGLVYMDILTNVHSSVYLIMWGYVCVYFRLVLREIDWNPYKKHSRKSKNALTQTRTPLTDTFTRDMMKKKAARITMESVE